VLEPLTPSDKLQWKWVGITLAMYALFYLLPLYFLGGVAEVFADIWIFAGIVIIAAVAGYLSEGITILEPAIAGAGLILLFAAGSMTLVTPGGLIFQAVIPTIIVMVIVFFLSLLGAWLGERAQRRWNRKAQEST
jgi:hypothetical protein